MQEIRLEKRELGLLVAASDVVSKGRADAGRALTPARVERGFDRWSEE